MLSARKIISQLVDTSTKIQQEYEHLVDSMPYADKLVTLYDQNKEQITYLQNSLILFFKEASVEERQLIWDVFADEEIDRVLIVMLRSHYLFTDSEGLKNRIILYIAQNFYPDPRDVIMSLGAIACHAREMGIDYDATCKEVAPLASDDNWSGMGSLRDYLSGLE